MQDRILNLCRERGIHLKIPARVGLVDAEASEHLIAAAAAAGFDALTCETVAKPGYRPTGLRIVLDLELGQHLKGAALDELQTKLEGLARHQLVELANLRKAASPAAPEEAPEDPPAWPRPLRLVDEAAIPEDVSVPPHEALEGGLEGKEADEADELLARVLADYRERFVDAVFAATPDTEVSEDQAPVLLGAAVSVAVSAPEPRFVWPADWPSRSEAYGRACSLLPRPQPSFAEACEAKGWDGVNRPDWLDEAVVGSDGQEPAGDEAPAEGEGTTHEVTAEEGLGADAQANVEKPSEEGSGK